jgi:hypothetical protein
MCAQLSPPQSSKRHPGKSDFYKVLYFCNTYKIASSFLAVATLISLPSCALDEYRDNQYHYNLAEMVSKGI